MMKLLVQDHRKFLGRQFWHAKLPSVNLEGLLLVRGHSSFRGGFQLHFVEISVTNDHPLRCLEHFGWFVIYVELNC